MTIAVEKGHLEDVRFLVEHGADVNSNGAPYSNNKSLSLSADIHLDGSALSTAARNGHLEVVHFLVEHGADVTKNGTLCIQIIMIHGHLLKDI